MEVMVRVELPVLFIVSVRVRVLPTWTLPKAMSPLSPMILVGVAVPVPEQEIVLVPLVLSELTVIVPPYEVTTVGANVTLTVWEPYAAIVPLLQFPLNPVG